MCIEPKEPVYCSNVAVFQVPPRAQIVVTAQKCSEQHSFLQAIAIISAMCSEAINKRVKLCCFVRIAHPSLAWVPNWYILCIVIHDDAYKYECRVYNDKQGSYC